MTNNTKHHKMIYWTGNQWETVYLLNPNFKHRVHDDLVLKGYNTEDIMYFPPEIEDDYVQLTDDDRAAMARLKDFSSIT